MKSIVQLMSPKEIQNSFFLTLMHYSGVFNTNVVLVNYSNMHAILILGTVSNHESALYSLYQIWVYDKEQVIMVVYSIKSTFKSDELISIVCDLKMLV